MSETPPRALPKFATSPSFPFDGQLRVKPLEALAPEPNRLLLDHSTCVSCQASDDAYVWVSERWRVRASAMPGGLPMVLVLETRSHLDLGDLPNMLAAELGVMTVRVERAIRSLDTVAHVHVTRHGEDSAHLQFEFSGRPVGRRQLAGPFLPLWNDILEPIAEDRWHEDLAAVAAWLGEFGGRAIAEPPRIVWHAPSTFAEAGGAPAAEYTAPFDEAAKVAAAKAAAEAMAAPIVESPDAVEPAAESGPRAASSDMASPPASAEGGPTKSPDAAAQNAQGGAPAPNSPPAEAADGATAAGVATPTEAAAEVATPTEARAEATTETRSSGKPTAAEPADATPANATSGDATPAGATGRHAAPGEATDDGGDDTYDDDGRAVGRATVDGENPAATARGFVALPRQAGPPDQILLNDADMDMSQH